MADSLNSTALGSQFAADAATRLTDWSRQVMGVSFEVQKALLDAMIEGNELAIGRMRTEMEIATEFFSKMAGVQSVHDIAEAVQDCARQQMEVVREESQRAATQGQHLFEKAAEIFQPRASAA